MKHQTLTSMGLVFLLMLSLTAVCAAQTNAPDFSIRDVDGNVVQLSSELQNGPVLIDFWATWCKPCKQAFPHIQRIYDKYKDQGFTVLAISVDNTRSVSKVRPFVRARRFEFPVLLDTDNEVLRRYGGSNIPLSVLIAPDGSIVKVWNGYQAGEEVEIERAVRELLSSNGGDL